MFSRSSLGGIRQGIREGKETAILRKRTFCCVEFFGLSLVHPWSFTREEWGRYNGRNLKKSTFINTHTLGGRAYPVRHYPIAIRLRTRKGCAILCIALNPQSGYFSGAILGVRSVALLHLGLLYEGDREGTREGNLKISALCA